jgi:transcriptional regulator with XRE-family HTH domain
MQRGFGMETLAQYLKRVMKQKNLGVRDVERNSGKKIHNSQVSKILNGVNTNPSLDTLLALAEGLQVHPSEMISALSGQAGDTLDASVLVDMLQKILANPNLIEVVNAWSSLPIEDQMRMMNSLQFVVEQNKPRKRKRR